MYVHGGNDVLHEPHYTSDKISFRNKINSDEWVINGTQIELGMHCMAQMDATTLLISGGYGRAPYLDCRQSTYFYSQSKLTQGPDMITRRAEHGCSFINDRDGNPTAIVAGGHCLATNGLWNAVEIYNRTLNIWESGPLLPVAMHMIQV